MSNLDSMNSLASSSMDISSSLNSSMIENQVFLGVFGFIFIISIILIIFQIICMWKMFKKAGKPGWASIVPIYNVIVFFDIVGYNWYYVFLVPLMGMIPLVGGILVLLFNISFSIKLAKSFDQSPGFGVGLLLLQPIFLAIIALSNNIKYKGQVVNGNVDCRDLF